MERVGKILGIVILILTLIFSIGYWSGFRLNSLSAAKANPYVGKELTLIDEVKFNWGCILILKTPEKPITAVCYKENGILWRSNFSLYYYNNNDNIQTIGGINVNDKERQASVLTILVKDPKVKYIEISTDENAQKKEVILNKPITFSWPIEMNILNMKPKAYGDNTELLYEYRYKQSNYTNPQDLKWYSVKNK